MRTSCPSARALVALFLSVTLAACQQTDQTLPFELAPGEVVSLQIGPNGGIVSYPPSFSVDIPAGALGSPVSVEVAKLVGEAFPGSAGAPVPGTAYDVQPIGTALAQPARVQIRIPDAAIPDGDEVLASVGVKRTDGSVVTYDGVLDLTSGVLTAEVDQLGPISVVINADAIAVSPGLPPALSGGSVPLPSAPAPAPVGPATADPQYGGVRFEATCSPDPATRQCYSSGLIRVWADEVVQRHIGDEIYFVNADVSADLEFLSFDASGAPTSVIGSITVDGALRAKFDASVDSYPMDDGVNTGAAQDPEPTGLTISGNVMTFDVTTSTQTGSIDFGEELIFAIDGIGTSEMLIIEVEAEVTFDDPDGGEEVGIVTAHVRLRR